MYNTALRSYTAKRIEEIGSADILVGIPCYNNEKTIAHVIQMITHGLAQYYPDRRCVIASGPEEDVLLDRISPSMAGAGFSGGATQTGISTSSSIGISFSLSPIPTRRRSPKGFRRAANHLTASPLSNFPCKW